MDTVANCSDKGSDTEVRQLRSRSHLYWEENKATNIRVASPSPLRPHPSADPNGGTWDSSHSVTLQLAAGAATGFHGLGTPLFSTVSNRVGVLRPRQPGQRGDAYLPKEYKAFSAVMREVRAVQEGKNQTKPNQILCFGAVYW